MPIFEFSCDKCGKDFEKITSLSDTSPTCPHCGASTTHKLMSACARQCRGQASSGYAPASTGGRCGGCSGGNCASCGH